MSNTHLVAVKKFGAQKLAMNYSSEEHNAKFSRLNRSTGLLGWVNELRSLTGGLLSVHYHKAVILTVLLLRVNVQ